MKLILFLIGRLIVIAFALIIALIAGSLFIGFGLSSGLVPELAIATDGQPIFDPDTETSIIAFVGFLIGLYVSAQLFAMAALPVTIAIAVTEMMRWRGLTIQLILGGICALFILFSAISLEEGQLPANGTVITTLAAGFVATFFYWLIAGRNAGEWMSPLYEEKMSAPLDEQHPQRED